MNALISITGSLKDKGHGVVARCPELDVYSQDYTKEEARRNIEEAVRLGTLKRILSEAARKLPYRH